MQARAVSRVFATLLLAVLLAAPALAGDEMIFVYPGKPGTKKQAKPFLAAFTSYIETHAGWSKGSLHADYWNDEKQAEKALEAGPQYGVLSLAIYLKWKKAGRPMQLLAQSELENKPTMQFHLIVPKDSKVHALADLEGANVASCFAEDRRFVTNVVFAKAVDAEKDIAIVQTKTIGSALSACAHARLMKDGRRVDALLVDDDQLPGLQRLESFSKLRVAWSSAPLPTPPVVTFASANPAQAQKLLDVLTGMSGSAPGRKVLEDLTTSGFRKPDAAAYAAVEKAY